MLSLNLERADSLSNGNHGNHHYYITILIIFLSLSHREFLTISFYFYPFLGYSDNNIIMYYYYFLLSDRRTIPFSTQYSERWTRRCDSWDWPPFPSPLT